MSVRSLLAIVCVIVAAQVGDAQLVSGYESNGKDGFLQRYDASYPGTKSTKKRPLLDSFRVALNGEPTPADRRQAPAGSLPQPTKSPQPVPEPQLYLNSPDGSYVVGPDDAPITGQFSEEGVVVEDDGPWWDLGLSSLFARRCICGQNCGGGCCGPRFFGGINYLYWWTRGSQLPSLVTTSPVGTPVGQAGVRGTPGVSTIFGESRSATGGHSGGRFTLGMNLDSSCCERLEFQYFVLNESDYEFSATAPGDDDIIGRPYFNTFTGLEDAELVGFPGIVDGRVDVRGTTDFEGIGIWWRHNMLCCNSCLGGGWCGDLCGPLHSVGLTAPRCQGRLVRFDRVTGWRHLDLDESLRIGERLVSTDPVGVNPPGTDLDIQDRFVTENKFDGFDVGWEWDWCFDRWGMTALVKSAFGNISRRATISGDTTVTTPGNPPVTSDGGLLAAPSNIGSFSDDEFALVPEVGLNLYYFIRPNARVRVGYNLIYFPNVWRPSGMVDLNVDPRQLPPPTIANATSPAFRPREADFWAQGLNLGLEFRF